MIDRKRIMEEVRQLPTFSNVVLKLYPLLQDGKAGSALFEETIRPDPSLTANLLRLCNSAYFGHPKQISSVRSAVTLLGPKRVCDIAVAAAISKVIPDSLPGYNLSALAFWEHSVAVAVLSEELAREIGKTAPDATFTSGLLHDIGKLVIGTFFEEHSASMMEKIRDKNLHMIESEREVLGCDHGQIGEEIGKQWGLPEDILLAIRYTNAPEELPEGSDRLLVDLVHVANSLAHMMGYGGDVGELSRKLDPIAAGNLDLKMKRIEFVASRTLDQIKDITEQFIALGGTN